MLNRIYQIPCEDGLKLLPDESVDLVIADPPYGIKFRSNIRKVRFDAIDNDDTFNFDWIDEAYRVLKVGGQYTATQDGMFTHNGSIKSPINSR